MLRKPELLAPAGNKEALVAAVENGADAVYLGGKMFNARQYADNFDDDSLVEVLKFAHLRGVKIYVTVNTLLDNGELALLAPYLKFLYEAGVDGIIIQDLGVAKLAHTLLPALPIHASTQMTIHNLEGVKVVQDLGFKRVVLAREVSLEEIREISRQCTIELEVFVHGALCISYSGQCLMSSLVGGRSGNRGKCAQPCRLPYTLVDHENKLLVNPAKTGQHLLSPRDLNMLAHLPELCSSGVSSLKIEGRMKRAEYVATVVRIYREAIDRLLTDPAGFRVDDVEQKQLAQIFNRDFTTGYFFGNPGRQMMSYKRPNNRGIRLGRITSYDPQNHRAMIRLEESLTKGDGIEVWVSQGGRVGTEIHRLWVDGQAVDKAEPGEMVMVEISGGLRPGDRVFKTHDHELVQAAVSTFTSPAPLRRIPLQGKVQVRIGQPLTVWLKDPDGNEASTATDFLAEPAIKRSLTEETVFNQLNRLGNTPFAIGHLDVQIDGEVMVPISTINEARRQAVDKLIEKRLARWQWPKVRENLFAANMHRLLGYPPEHQKAEDTKEPLLLMVNAGDLEGVHAAVENGANGIYFGGEFFTHKPSRQPEDYAKALNLCRSKEVKIIFSTPRIVHQPEMREIRKMLEYFQALQPDGVLIGNLGVLNEAKRVTGLPMYGDYPLNVYNALTVQLLLEQGLSGLTLSPELNWQQIGKITEKTPVDLECLVHGRLTMMVSKHCVLSSLLGGSKEETNLCSHPCRKGSYGLRDRMRVVFPLVTDQYCRSHIFNAKELCMLQHLPVFAKYGIKRLRIEGKIESPAYLGKLTRAYRLVLDNPDDEHLMREVIEHILPLNENAITKGHYFRGV